MPESKCNSNNNKIRIGSKTWLEQDSRKDGLLLNILSFFLVSLLFSFRTTVVGPLLALILGDGKQLVTQVVPQSLLEFSRGCMRAIFSSLVQKPVFTFQFDRFQTVTQDLYFKLLKARERRAVVVASPTSVKSFSLKFIEILHHLDRIKNEIASEETGGSDASKSSQGGGFLGFIGLGRKAKDRNVMIAERAQLQKDLRLQAVHCVQILKLFRDGALLLDEVDLILHPLKSELNWVSARQAPQKCVQMQCSIDHLLRCQFE